MNSTTLIDSLPAPRRSNLWQAMERLPKWLMYLLLPAMTMTIGWADYAADWEWSLFVLYAAPILMAVWWQGLTFALVLAVLSAGVWWSANFADNPYQTTIGYNMAMMSRFVYFVTAAIGGAAVRNKQEADASRIEMLEERRRLEQDIVAVSEHEQQRIGQDLHDGLCQQLAAVGCAVRALADDLQAKDLPEALDAAHIGDSIQQAVIEARNLARGIYPVHVDRAGLSTALSDLAASTSRLTGLRIQLVERVEVHLNDPDVAMHLYRIAQEAVANAVRHSGTQEVSISLEVSDSQLELRIDDCGCGFNADSDFPREGMGLRTMRYRAQSLGAHLTIERRPEGGSSVRCRLKVRNDSNPPLCHGQT